MDLLPGITTSAAALGAERLRLEIIAQNIANANTTRGANGLPYQRQQVAFASVLAEKRGTHGPLAAPAQTVRVSRIASDPRPPRSVYQPGHPDANAEGMVAFPDINIHEEMADYIVASRAYEANLAAIKNSRNLALATLAIGRR